MSLNRPANACRLCGATSYRRVVARDGAGEMRASGLFQCSGCSAVFTDPKAWRGSMLDRVGMPPAPTLRPTPAAVPASESRAPMPGALSRPVLHRHSVG